VNYNGYIDICCVIDITIIIGYSFLVGVCRGQIKDYITPNLPVDERLRLLESNYNTLAISLPLVTMMVFLLNFGNNIV
jgi:hypothetical protein